MYNLSLEEKLVKRKFQRLSLEIQPRRSKPHSFSCSGNSYNSLIFFYNINLLRYCTRCFFYATFYLFCFICFRHFGSLFPALLLLLVNWLWVVFKKCHTCETCFTLCHVTQACLLMLKYEISGNLLNVYSLELRGN